MDCPYCDGWRFPGWAAPAVMVKLHERPHPPVVWDGQRLRQGYMSETPDPLALALAAHICEAHWEQPEVIALGPIGISEGYAV